MPAILSDWLVRGSYMAVFLGANLFLHSTLIILVGFAGAAILAAMKKGAAIRSLFLRVCLAAVLISPAALVLVTALHLEDRYLTTPFLPSGKEPVPVSHSPVVRVPKPVPAPSATNPDHGPPGERTREDRARSSGKHAPTPSLSSGRFAPAPPQKPVATGYRKALTVSHVHGLSGWFSLVFSVTWSFLSLFLIIRAAAIMLYVRRIRILASPARAIHAETCQSAARDLGIAAPPVLQSRYVTGTILTGFLHPAILIPLGENESFMATREVFLHELAHLARRDHLWLLLCQLGKILLPFQPLVWMLARRTEETSDYACDDYVLNHTVGCRPYAVQLFTIASSLQASGAEGIAGAGIVSAKSPLRKRIEHILDNSYARHVKASANEVMSFTIIFLCAVTLTGFAGIRGEDSQQAAYASERHAFPESDILRSTTTTPVNALARESLRSGPHGKRTKDSIHTAGAPHQESSVPAENFSSASEQTNPVSDDSTGVPPAESTPSPLIAESKIEAAPSLSTLPASALELAAAEAPHGISDDTSPDKSGAAPSGKQETASPSTLPPSLLELHAAATDRREFVIAKPGPVEISIPGWLPAGLRESLEQGQESPVWSPAGKLIAFTGMNGAGVWVVSALGGRPVLVYDNTDDQISGGSAALRKSSRTLSFTPNGRWLTILNFKRKPPVGGAVKEASTESGSLIPVVETIDLATGERRVIAENASEGCWSPDGRHFAYVDADYYGITVLDTGSGSVRRISESGKFPCFTPDGSSIIYVDWQGSEIEQLFQTPIAGGKPEQLTTDGNWWEPEISPDGEWVLCTGFGIPQYGQNTLLRAFNLRERMSYFIMVEGAETAEMGTWSPSGR